MHLTGQWTDFGVAFLAGLLVSFTPCLYPVLPLTVGLISSMNTRTSHWVGFGLSLIYVLGIALVYSLLAVVAALTGQVFGQWQNQSVVYFIVGTILIFFGCAMIGWVSLPSVPITFQPNLKHKNLRTLLLMGMVSGLIVGPCTSPVLGSLLIYAASKQNVLHAVSLLFVFSYGIGFSLILAGTFSGFLKHFPKSGVWMDRVKVVGAILIMIMGLYFLWQGIVIAF